MSCFGFIPQANGQNCQQECILNVQVDIPQTIIPVDPGGGGGAGAAVGIPVGAAAIGGLGAFAPLLLAGLSPGSVIAAAAPLGCLGQKACFLQTALKNHFNTTNLNTAIEKARTTASKSFFAVNDRNILNGTFDIQDIELPAKLNNAPKIGYKGTLVSSPYKDVAGKPEIELRIFKDISKAKLEKRYTSQGFRKKFLMKKYEVPYSTTMASYSKGVHEFNGIIDKASMKNPAEPIRTVVNYTEGGFQKDQAIDNPKVKTYAYIIEFTALK